MGDITKNFSAHEFACPCCGESKMNLGTVRRLQMVRDAFGRRINVAEGGGYRCADYDSNDRSSHRIGMAVDTDHAHADHYELMRLFFMYGFTGIGDKSKDGKFQLHGDDAPNELGIRTRPWKWTY